jgi:hypothetical protein
MTPSPREFLALIGSTAIGPPRFGHPEALKPKPGRWKISRKTSNPVVPRTTGSYLLVGLNMWRRAETEKFLQANDIVSGIERREHHEFRR